MPTNIPNDSSLLPSPTNDNSAACTSIAPPILPAIALEGPSAADLARLCVALLREENTAPHDISKRLFARRQVLQDEAAWLHSGDVTGALFHLCLISDVADTMAHGDLDDGEMDAHYAAIIRMLGSVLHFIEATLGVRRIDLGFQGYLPDRQIRRAFATPATAQG